MRSSYLLERAWVDGAVRADVLVEISGGRFTRVSPADRGNPRDTPSGDGVSRGFPRLTGETRSLPGLTLPGLANCHSHAFHRALRGRTQRGRGTFWTWRDQMYGVAGRLDPDSYFALARATYREMAASGITTVGEFHYLHHQPDGTPYDEPNAMGIALHRGCPRGRHPDRAARHLLPVQRLRAAARGRPGPLLRRRRRALGRAGHEPRPSRSTPGSAPRSTPSEPSRATSSPRSSTGLARRDPRTRRCTSTSPSRSPRTTPAWRRTA